ncbi:putative sphingomyelin phosphodiesterase 2 isoform X2 [Sesbania bispinosa]|nr:putative sphingomyelin phosphodiesterase 2 isoform X2 [Sesbania bispinosa]
MSSKTFSTSSSHAATGTPPQSSQLMNSMRTRHGTNQFFAPQLSPSPTTKTLPMRTGTDTFALHGSFFMSFPSFGIAIFQK